MVYMASIIHLLTCIFVVIFILLQDPKGGVLGTLGGGGGSKSLFGTGGASNFLVQTTKWLAIVFASTSIYLSYVSSNQDSDLMSGLKNVSSEESPADSKPPVNSKTNPKTPVSK